MESARLIRYVAVVLALTFCTSAQATLFDRGNGLIYNDVFDITYLQNADLGAGSAFDDGFSNTDGLMTYANAVAWADSLVYQGFDGWRLPTTSPVDGVAFNLFFSNNATTDRGTARTTTDGTDGGWRDSFGNPLSELGHMYYVNLGNLGQCTPNDAAPDVCDRQAGEGLSNTSFIDGSTGDTVSFLNLSSVRYWTGAEVSPTTPMIFDFIAGTQGGGNSANSTTPGLCTTATLLLSPNLPPSL